MTTSAAHIHPWNRYVIAAITFVLLCCILPCPLRAQEPLTLDQANQALEEGRFEEALATYKQLLTEDPENISLKARLAHAYYLASNSNPEYFYAAVKEYSALIATVPDFSLSYLDLGQISYLLGLEASAKGKDKHANGLFTSALDWYQKYTQLEAEKASWDSKREVVVTLVLEAAVWVRLGEDDEAVGLLKKAQENYSVLILQNPEYSSLYDYLTISAVEYVSSRLYNQALIYIEGAWLLQPRPQLESLFQAAIKAKDMNLSLPSLSTEGISGESTSFLTTTETVQLLQEQVRAISSQLSSISTLQEQVSHCQSELLAIAQLQSAVSEFQVQLKEIRIGPEGSSAAVPALSSVVVKPGTSVSVRLEELATRLTRLEEHQEKLTPLSEETVQLQSASALETLEASVARLSHLEQQIDSLEQQMQIVTDTIEHLRAIADMYNVLALQLQDLKAVVREIETGQ